MSKLINAEDLRNAMYHEAFEKESKMQKWESGCWIRYKLFENVLDAMPSADVRENIHGEWIMLTDGMNFYAYECSVCHKVCAYYSQENSKYDFCPNCGADMRGATDA